MSLGIDQAGTYFIVRPDDGETPDDLLFELAGEWYAVDGDKLLLPINPIEKTGDAITRDFAILTQYGGTDLLLQMATSGDLEVGTRWMLTYSNRQGFQVEPVPSDA